MKTTVAGIKVDICDTPFLAQILVRVYQEDGTCGIGECWWGVEDPTSAEMEKRTPHHLLPIVSTIEHLLKPLLIGHDSSRIANFREKAIRRAYRYGTDGIFMCALSGIDLALWDLLGKNLGVSVAGLLGGPVKDSIRTYASLPPLKNREAIEREVKRAIDHGYTGVKLHETDPETAGWARDVTGPDIAIMFDVNGAFSPLQAWNVADKLSEHDIYWFEEPIQPERDLQSLARLRKASGMTLAAGENEFGLERFYSMIENNGVDVIMPEICKIGGLTVAKQISVLAGMFNRTLSPHGFRIGPALYANIHWALTTPNSDWLEMPFLPEGFAFPAKIRQPPIIDGKVFLPSGSGLGLAFLTKSSGDSK